VLQLIRFRHPGRRDDGAAALVVVTIMKHAGAGTPEPDGRRPVRCSRSGAIAERSGRRRRRVWLMSTLPLATDPA